MIKQSKRLSRALFEEVFKKGRVVSTPFFLVKKVSHPGVPARYAVSVPKKQAPRALVRNKLRRRMYTALHSFQDVSGVYCIFLPKKEITEVSLDILREEIKRSIQ